MGYQKWLGRTIENLQEDGEFINFFAFAELDQVEDKSYLINESLGIEAVFDKIHGLRTIYFYSENHQGFSEFKQPLPLNLNFSLNDSQVRELLGQPQAEGGDDYSMIYGITPKWQKYFFDDCDIHVQYRNRGESIEMITLMKPRLF